MDWELKTIVMMLIVFAGFGCACPKPVKTAVPVPIPDRVVDKGDYTMCFKKMGIHCRIDYINNKGKWVGKTEWEAGRPETTVSHIVESFFRENPDLRQILKAHTVYLGVENK